MAEEPWSNEGASGTLSLLTTYGAMEGPLSFGLIVGAAVRRDGALAVADLHSCSVTLLERPSGNLLRRYGQCGDGPAEFRQIRAIAFHGDSLLVHDQAANTIVVLDSVGTELSRARLDSGGDPTFGIASMDVLDDSTLVVALERLTDAFVGTLDLTTGAIRRRLVGPPPIASIGPQRTVRRLASCLHAPADNPLAVVMNTWAFEGLALTVPQKGEVFHFLTSSPIVPIPRSDGSWSGESVMNYVTCGGSGAIFRNRMREREGGPQVTWLEMRGYDGALLLRERVTDPDSHLQGFPGAMIGDTLFVFRNRQVPLIAEYVVLQ